MAGIEARVDDRDVLEPQRIQPALGIHAPERVATVALRTAGLDNGLDEFCERRCSLLVETRFISGRAKDYFFFDLKRSRSICQSRPGKLQPVETERKLRGRNDGDLSLRRQGENLVC